MNITVVSNFPKNESALNGQTIKANFLIEALRSSSHAVKVVDYSEYKKKPISTFFSFVKGVRKADAIIMLPDRGALTFLSKWCLMIKRKHSKVFYDVVGGWLPLFLKERPKLIRNLVKFNGIWVENSDMLSELFKLGLQNSTIIKNFKFYLSDVFQHDYSEFKHKIGKFVFLSRIDPDKGIFETIEGIVRAHRDNPSICLDVYGPIKDVCKEQFLREVEKHKECINYKGTIDPKNANNIMKQYYMQFFLTKLSTEGIPGSIIDSFAAGVPILYSVWNPNFNMIVNHQTGLKADVGDIEDIVDIIKYSVNNPLEIFKMSQSCYFEYKKNYDFKKEYALIEEELNK